MAIVSTPSNALAADARTLNTLKLGAGQDSPAAIKETAKQLESLFMRELIKSMRQANNSMKSGMMDSAGGDLGADLLDEQFSVSMSGMPGCLAPDDRTSAVTSDCSREMLMNSGPPRPLSRICPQRAATRPTLFKSTTKRPKPLSARPACLLAT